MSWKQNYYIHFDLNHYTKDFENLKRVLYEKMVDCLGEINSQRFFGSKINTKLGYTKTDKIIPFVS
jgi:hypothetical protein